MRRVALLSPTWRLVSAALVAVSLATLPTYLVALVVLPPVPPMVMIRSFLVGTALPWLVAVGILRAFAGTVEAAGGTLRLRRGDVDVDVPLASIATVRPWRASLPRPGIGFVLGSGRRLPLGVALDRPATLLDVLAEAGVDVRDARRRPSVVHAETRRAPSAWRWLGKFVVFGVVPAGILFYTHQHIAYGGTFGQWNLEGLGPYLRTFWEYWGTTIVLLVSWASLWRAAGEVAVFATAAARPAWAPMVRRVVEWACAIAYWGGVPALLVLRYAA